MEAAGVEVTDKAAAAAMGHRLIGFVGKVATGMCLLGPAVELACSADDEDLDMTGPLLGS